MGDKKKLLKAIRYWLKAKDAKVSILGSIMLEGLRQRNERQRPPEDKGLEDTSGETQGSRIFSERH